TVTEEWSAMSTSAAHPDRLGAVMESPFTEGRIVLVSIGEGDPTVRRVVSTIAKALFQVVAGSRLTRAGQPDEPDDALKNPSALVWRFGQLLLGCDEYGGFLTERNAVGLSNSIFFSRSRQYLCLNLLALQSVHMGMSRVPNPHLWGAIVGNANVRIF